MKLVSGERAGAPLMALAFPVAEGDGALVDGEDAPVGDGDAVDVAGEVIEHSGFALSPRFAPGDPILRPYAAGQLRFEVGTLSFEGVVELIEHESGQGAHGHEERMFGLAPRSTVLSDAVSRRRADARGDGSPWPRSRCAAH